MSFRSITAVVVLAFVGLGLGGCAAESNEPSDEKEAVVVAPKEGELAPQKLGHIPQVTRADFVLPAGSCVGNLCTVNGVSWDCGNPNLCTRITE